jgi:hypothetical protein
VIAGTLFAFDLASRRGPRGALNRTKEGVMTSIRKRLVSAAAITTMLVGAAACGKSAPTEPNLISAPRDTSAFIPPKPLVPTP